MSWQAILTLCAAIAGPLSLMQLFMKRPPRKVVLTDYDQWLEDERSDWPRRMARRGLVGFAVVLVVGLPFALLAIWLGA
jgi:hypothetical protein